MLALLSGCTVPAGGSIALAMTADGELVAHVQMCEGHIDGASLYRTDVEPRETLGMWEAEDRVTDAETWPLLNGGNGWAVTSPLPLPPLEADGTYRLYGWTDDNSWSANGPDFTLEDLHRLQSQQVLYWNDDWGPDGNTPTNKVADRATFAEDACR